MFSAAGTRYALAMGQVIEVGPVPPVTPLPRVPSWLLGVSNLRGDILAVLDFRRFLDQEPNPHRDLDRMLVLRTANGLLSAGLVVDRVHGVGSVAPDAVRPPAAPVDDPVHRFLQGVAEQDDKLLAILDAEKLLTSSELRPFASADTPSDIPHPANTWAAETDVIGPSPIH